MVDVAQLVRVPDCDSGCCRFESGHPPLKKRPRESGVFFYSGISPRILTAYGSRDKLSSLLHDRSPYVSLSPQPQLNAWGFMTHMAVPEYSLGDLSSSAFELIDFNFRNLSKLSPLRSELNRTHPLQN